MSEYRLPAGYGTAEYTEKKSRFIGQVWPVKTESEARERIEEVKKRHHDARHNCWCYLLRDGTLRYSDDGEPQGTAGQPMLAVFQHEDVSDAVCVVTRYFGGILLGTGGLARAYTKAARDALSAAGISVEQLWDRMCIDCGYSLFEQLRLLIARHGGMVENTDYSSLVTLTVLIPVDATSAFTSALQELSAGKVEAVAVEQVYGAAAPEKST